MAERRRGRSHPRAIATSSPRPAFFRLAAFYAATFGALGVYMQFFPVWLHDIGGLSHQQVTQAQSGQILARTIAGPFWAQRVDRTGRPARMVVWLSGLSVLAFLLFGFAEGLGSLLLCCAVYGCVYPPLHSILDNLAIRQARQEGFRFPRLRSLGSLAFLCAIVAMGAVLAVRPSAWVFGVMLGLLLLAFALALRLPEPSMATRAAGPAPMAQLFKNRTFVLFLCASGLIQGSHGGFYALSTLFWRANGIDEGTAGLLWAEGIVSEIVLFFFIRDHAERLRPTTLMLIGAAAAAARWLLLAQWTEPLWIAAVNWLHALSFGVTYLGALQFLRLRVDDGLQTTAQGLLGAFNSGLFMALGTVVAGFCYEREPAWAFVAMAVLAFLGGVLALWLRRPRTAFLRDEKNRTAMSQTASSADSAAPQQAN